MVTKIKKDKLLRRIAKCLHRKSEFQMDRSERRIANLLVEQSYGRWKYVSKHGGYDEFRREENTQW